ncbi:MAG: tRNA lysidine(34) synthetase TilS [Acidobacteria bacterium]|nr:MAG: tRNA lysidine(34) synthetase TilS [Acidobacteriota bacterium]
MMSTSRVPDSDAVIRAAGPRILRELTRPWAPGRGSLVVVAVSGGGDSTALLRLLAGLAPGRGWRLVAATLDHGLRGASSADDVRFVTALAADLGVPLEVSRLDAVPGSEDAARRARLAFLADVARRHGAGAVALAHTMDDQAETVLQRLARGAGTAGLAAMRRWRPPWWRPLLGVRRRDLRTLLERLGQAWREDETNVAPDRLRSRLRGRVLPALERAAGPGTVAALARHARLAAEDDLLLEQLAAERLGDVIVATAPGRFSCSRAALRGLPGPLARRIVRRLVAALGRGTTRLEADHVDAVLGLLAPDARGMRIELPRGVTARRERGLLVLETPVETVR